MACDPCKLFVVYHLREIFECCPPGLLTRVRILFAVLVSAQTKSSLYFVFFLFLLRTDEGMEPVENRIFIAYLPYKAMKKDVEEHFAQFGTLTDVYIPLRFGNPRHKGIAFVTFESGESLVKVAQHPTHMICGKIVAVDYAAERQKSTAGKQHDISDAANAADTI